MERNQNNVSLEQGDVNISEQRTAFINALGPETRDLIEEDARYFLHQALSTPVMNALRKTEGAWIEDFDGNRYIDLHGNGVHNAGFSNPEVIQAVIAQLQAGLAFTPRRYTNIPTIELARKLVQITPKDLTRVLFCPGGSEAIEMAVSLAKHITGNWKTISYWDSYHGNGFQSSSLGGEEHFSTGLGPMMPGAFHIEFPNYYRNPWRLTNEEEIDHLYLRQLDLILQRNPDIAAIVAEPISATPVIPSRTYWEQIRYTCDKHGIFLIFDEIIEGFGRTGKWFATEHFVTPDVLVLGKSLGGGILPAAGIVTHEKYNVLQHRSIGHFTHEKNPMSAAAGLAAINYIEKNGLVQNSEVLGKYLADQLSTLKEQFPVIGNVAGKGLHLGIDLVLDPTTKQRAVQYAEQVMYACMKQGVALKTIEGNILTIRPSLVITKDDCDFIVSTLSKVLSSHTPR
ncbi:aspartate aminotransferase family protein [Chryseolinea sp. T2]|uniref:(R)-1-hydroxy-2-aminoethylphosphonate ammonia-lyase n=1 Tax=Chryseolinea sp. T2 TaxID=3129255 RepID=UPI00307877D3